MGGVGRFGIAAVAAAVLSSVLGLGGCVSAPPLALGEPCDVDAECESALCAGDAGVKVCAVTCGPEAPCPSALACGPDGVCIARCPLREVRGSGASAEICVDGLFIACSDLDAVRYCDDCGCEPFGGGQCFVASLGCVELRANGEACTDDALCESGACHRDSGTCGPPRAEGEACSADAECTTRNCTTDGNEAAVGVCGPVLGSPCDPDATVCTRCIVRDFLSSTGICSRLACSLSSAPNCPTLGDREWECARSVEGSYHCYETCDQAGYSCYSDAEFCNGAYCG